MLGHPLLGVRVHLVLEVLTDLVVVVVVVIFQTAKTKSMWVILHGVLTK